MKEKTCWIIGHQNLRDYNLEKMEIVLEEQIKRLIEKGVEYFFTSCRLGFETLGALKVLKVHTKKAYGFGLWIMMDKEKEQLKHWSKKDLKIYEEIKNTAAEQFFATSESKGHLLWQHKDMINYSKYVLVAFNGKDIGATQSAVNYAIQQEKEIIYLDMKSLLRDFKSVTNEESWKTRKDFIFSSSIDFSIENFDQMVKDFNIDKEMEQYNENANNLLDKDKEENYKLAKNVFYSLAEENGYKVNLMQFHQTPYKIVELENKSLNFNNSRSKRRGNSIYFLANERES